MGTWIWFASRSTVPPRPRSSASGARRSVGGMFGLLGTVPVPCADHRSVACISNSSAFPRGRQVKNRLHLGCTAGDLDRLDDEIGRLEELGATVAWEEEFPTEVAALYRNVVLRDVEGNEFCLGAGHMPSAPPAEDVEVRDARGDDRRRIVELAARLADSTPPWRDRTAADRAVTGSVSALVDDAPHDGAILVAEAEGEVVGFVSLSHRRHFTGAVDASIDDLVVAEDWEGRGIAGALLNAAEAWAREQSLARITVETIAGNDRAKRRYRSFGYRDEDLRLTKELGTDRG